MIHAIFQIPFSFLIKIFLRMLEWIKWVIKHRFFFWRQQTVIFCSLGTLLISVLVSMCKKFELVNLSKCLVQEIDNHFSHTLIIFCSFRALYSICLTFFYVHQFVRVWKGYMCILFQKNSILCVFSNKFMFWSI